MNNNSASVKVILLLAFLFVSNKGFSYSSQSTAALSKFINQPIELEVVNSIEQNKDRRTLKTNGFNNQFDTSLLYEISKKDEVRLYGSLMYSKFDGEKSKTNMHLVEGMYRRKSLLRESKYGVNLDFELKNYVMLNKDIKEYSGSDGALIPQFIFSKHFNRKFHMEAKLRHMFYSQISDEASSLKNESRVYLSPTYIFSRWVMFNTTFTYKHVVRNGKSRYSSEVRDRLKLTPSIMMPINMNMMVQFYANTHLMESHDKSFIHPDWLKEMVAGVSVYFTII